ncbi:MarR family transcriptional regulator [Streptomyces sp. NPDC089919]|uniref:MarR family winged helix-turn-helix transcriptional regulator n=1 Tax=Streptomyces sp. NPDC089919 TaxID=3155188 RepID=UPI00342118E9
MPHRPDEVSQRVIALFAAINRRYAHESESAAAGHGLTPLQAKALQAALEPTPMRKVAEQLGAEPSNLTPVVDRLEARGLVERSPSPDDRRVKVVAATEEGRTVAADLRARMPFAADPLQALDPAQRAALGDLLQLIADTRP